MKDQDTEKSVENPIKMPLDPFAKVWELGAAVRADYAETAPVYAR